jgi:Flp pilus assembly protein TadD
MLLRATGAALLLVSTAGCLTLTGPSSPLKGWHGVESDSVRIVAEATAEEVEVVASDLAYFDAAFALLTGQRPGNGESAPTLYLVRDPRLARQLRLGFAVGWATSRLEGSFACLRLGRQARSARTVLFHEYTHLQLVRNRRAPLARWYNEGLAEYFGTLWHRDGALIVGANTDRLPWLAKRGPMPLDRLFSGSLYEMEAPEILDFYATAWALTHYLMGSTEGRQALSRFEKELARGVAADEARDLAFGRSSRQLEAELAAHIGYLTRGVAAEAVLDLRRIAVSPAPPPRSMSAGEVASELARLLLALGDHPEGRREQVLALRLLRTAVHEDPHDPRTQAALGRALAMNRDPDAAESALAIALKEAPGDPWVHLHAGHAALASEDLEDAKSHFEDALAIDERFAAAWFGLGVARARAKENDTARAALEEARRVAWSSELDLELGRLELAAGRREAALELLWPLAQDPHGGAIREEAAKLLKDSDLNPAGAGTGAAPDGHESSRRSNARASPSSGSISRQRSR